MKIFTYKSLILFFALLLGFSINTKATHVLGGDISWKGLGDYKYEVTLKMYRDCSGIAFAVNGKSLILSCTRGNVSDKDTVVLPSIGWKEITNLCDTVSNPPCGSGNSGFSGKGIEEHIFRTIIDFNSGTLISMRNNGCCRFKLSFGECCRNAEITTGPANNYFELDAEIDICNIDNSIKKGNDNSPVFSIQPVWSTCCNQPFTFNCGAREMDGDSISFSLVAAKASGGSSVNYNTPFNPTTWPMTGFCLSSSPCACREDRRPSLGFCFDNNTGNMTFHPIECNQSGVLALKVDQWRLDSTKGHWLYLGYNIRDIQLNVINCIGNNPPVLTIENDSLACSDDSLCVNIKATDEVYVNYLGSQPWLDTISLSWDSSFLHSTFEVYPPYFDTTNQVITAVRDARLCWLKDDRLTGYHFTVSAKDKACPLTAISTKGHKVNSLLKSKADPVVSIGKCGNVKLGVTNIDTTVYKGTYQHNWSIANIAKPDSVIFSSTNATASTFLKGTGQYIVSYNLNNPPYNCPMYYIDTISLLQNDSNSHETVASFSVSPSDSQCLNSNVFNFIDNSTAGSGTLNWTWVLGNLDTLNTQNPNYTFTQPGNYQITLKVENTYGCRDSISKNVFVHQVPNVIIGINDSVQCFTGHQFAFNDISTIASGSVVSRTWKFGDGTSSDAQSGNKTYNLPGEYNLMLLSTSNYGCVDSTNLKLKVVENAISLFTISDSVQCFDANSFQFVNQSTVPSNSVILWSFGDGTSSSSLNPTKSYANTGVYNVKLSHNSGAFCSDSFNMNVTVNPSPKIIFILGDTILRQGDTANYLSSSISQSRVWLINTGQIISGQNDSNVTVQWTDSGYHSLTHIVENSFGCGDTASLFVYVADTNSLSVMELASSKIKLYPNPVKDFLTIDSDGKISNVKIFDAKGALIKVEHNKSEIDVRELITGIYFVQVTLESGEVYINKIEKY